MNRKIPSALFGVLVGVGILVLLKSVVKDPPRQPEPSPPPPPGSVSPRKQQPAQLPSQPAARPEPPDITAPANTPKPGSSDDGVQDKWDATQALPANEQYLTRQKLLSEWIMVNPPAAIRAFSSVDGEQRSALIPSLAKAWATISPKDAADWALQLPDEHSPRALAAVVSSWSKDDRPAALEYAVTIKGSQYRQETLKALARDWEGPPSQAASWLLSLPEDPAKDKAILALTTHWSRSSKQAAKAWTHQLLPSETKDHALLGLSRGILANDPGEALDLALQINHSSSKATQVRTIINDYARTCLACHRKGEGGCLRVNLSAIPPEIVPSSMKEKVLQTVRKIHVP